MENHVNQSPAIPKWSALLIEAVKKPGLIMKAYSDFHPYSVGNQILALVQCQMRVGWHTFRHTFGTILNANGENPKVIQELLRHANLKVTMDTYVQAVSDEKRNAQSKVVKMLLPGVRKREAV